MELIKRLFDCIFSGGHPALNNISENRPSYKDSYRLLQNRLRIRQMLDEKYLIEYRRPFISFKGAARCGAL